MRGLSIQAKLNDTDRALRESSFCVCPYNISFVVSFTCQWYRWPPLYGAFFLYSLQQVTQLVKWKSHQGEKILLCSEIFKFRNISHLLSLLQQKPNAGFGSVLWEQKRKPASIIVLKILMGPGGHSHTKP